MFFIPLQEMSEVYLRFLCSFCLFFQQFGLSKAQFLNAVRGRMARHLLKLAELASHDSSSSSQAVNKLLSGASAVGVICVDVDSHCSLSR